MIETRSSRGGTQDDHRDDLHIEAGTAGPSTGRHEPNTSAMPSFFSSDGGHRNLKDLLFCRLIPFTALTFLGFILTASCVLQAVVTYKEQRRSEDFYWYCAYSFISFILTGLLAKASFKSINSYRKLKQDGEGDAGPSEGGGDAGPSEGGGDADLLEEEERGANMLTTRLIE